MNIKRFVARDTREAIKMVKKEMGSDAVILRTRTISLKDGNNKRIEVTAAVDYDISDSTTSGVVSHPNTYGQLETDLKEIKNALICADASPLLSPDLYFNRELRDKYTNYKTFGLKPEIIRDLMYEGKGKKQDEKKATSRLLQESLMNVLSKINIDKTGSKEREKRIYSFIGPTGVGKTTTLAKLAALSSIEQGEKTAMITLDTFRIAATAQLQTYARIMDIPLEVAANRDDLQKAVEKHVDCDRIFIDTAGRSPNNVKDIADLKNMLSICADIHPYLVLSANTQYQSLLNAEKQFGTLSYKSYIFTKLDETEDASTIINFLISRRKPVSFFTAGQQVPEDIELASKKRLATLLLAGMSEMSRNNTHKGKIDGSSHWS